MQQVIKQLEDILAAYTSRLQSIPEKDFAIKLSAEKWSKKEILGHLVDSAQNNIQRFVRAGYENRPHVVYDQDVWVAAQGYQNYPTAALIMLWQLLNKHICTILNNMQPDIYSRLCDTGRDEETLYTVEFLAKDYIVHLVHHLKQIFNT
jgi:DinB superfamily